MMRLRLLLLVLVCFTPSVARAQDGGWIEWLEKMSGPKLWGIGTDVHLFCIDNTNKVVSCERYFGLKNTDVNFENIRHQFDFRAALYWKYGGARFSDDPADRRNIKAAKLMGMYRYFAKDWLEVGFGAGFMPFFGDGFDLFTRGIITPLSVTIAPIKNGVLKAVVLRTESSYITTGFTGADFGNPVTKFSTGGEWNTSFAIGYDFRRHKR